ncbi:hypothetical protein [Streptomyces sp. NPDC054958]
MDSPSGKYTIREATTVDAAAIRDIYGGGDVQEFTFRLADRASASATKHYIAQSEDQVIAAFALTALGRLRPGGKSRLILHEIKIRPNARGTGLTEEIFHWMAVSLGVGTDRDLLALTPLGQQPSAFDRFGLSESHKVFRWNAMNEGELP